MAKGRKARVKEPFETVEKEYTGWTTTVKLKRSLMTPYRISGKVDDIIEIPTNLVDELVKQKKVEVI